MGQHRAHATERTQLTEKTQWTFVIVAAVAIVTSLFAENKTNQKTTAGVPP